MKIIRIIIRIYKILMKIGSYIDFKKIMDDFKGKKEVENGKRVLRNRKRRSDK